MKQLPLLLLTGAALALGWGFRWSYLSVQGLPVRVNRWTGESQHWTSAGWITEAPAAIGAAPPSEWLWLLAIALGLAALYRFWPRRGTEGRPTQPAPPAPATGRRNPQLSSRGNPIALPDSPKSP